MITINNLWAKINPFKSVYSHSMDAANVIKRLLEEYYVDSLTPALAKALQISKKELVNLAQYIAAVHDIGKIHPAFQCKNEDKDKDEDGVTKQILINEHMYCGDGIAEGYRHESGSYFALRDIWKTNKIFDDIFKDTFSSVIRNHHQGKTKGDISKNPKTEKWMREGESSKTVWEQMQNDFEKEMRDKFHPVHLQWNPSMKITTIGTLFTGLLIHADWIASSCFNGMSLDEYYNQMIEVDKLIEKDILQSYNNFSDLFPFITEDSMRPMQKEIRTTLMNSTEMPKCVILEDMMGGGKTECAMYLAMKMGEYYHKTGVVVGLPTMATANAIWKRVNSMLDTIGRKDSKLIHSNSWMELTPEDRDFTNSSKTALFDDFGVCTVDQMMSSVLTTTYSMLKMCALSNKVLIIDEIHSYDTYMSTIINRMLEWCNALNIPVILLSATLPKNKKAEILSIYSNDVEIMDGYPLITYAYDNKVVQHAIETSTNTKFTINTVETEEDTFISSISNKLINFCKNIGGCACGLVNTVNDAQAVYRFLSESDYIRQNNIDVILFHSRYTVARREEIESEIISKFGKNGNRPSNAIVVATQVAEQSLDIDFDYMVTELAPMDLILQRLGRVFRHKETKRNVTVPVIDIVKPHEESKANKSNNAIYYPLILDNTYSILNNITTINLPKDIAPLVNNTYNNMDVTEDNLEKWFSQDIMEKQKATMAKQVLLKSPLEIKDREYKFEYKKVNEDNESELVFASTRLTSETKRIAILPADQFAELEERISNNQNLPIDFAKNCMKYVFTATAYQSTEINNSISKTDVLMGIGKLKGITFLEADRDYLATDSCRSKVNPNLIIDKKLGFFINY